MSDLRHSLEARNPHPLFDHSYYLETNPDVAAAGINPLRHYVEVGAGEGRSPHPLFDAVFYVHRNPGVAAAGINPLLHYMENGARPGHDPHPLFDTAYYLRRNLGVAAAGVNPLLHYLEKGANEGYDPHPLFDGRFYIERYPDLDPDEINPLVHYVRYGAKEGRDPSPFFDATFYLETNREVRKLGINPLVHFVLHGALERKPCQPLDALCATQGRSFDAIHRVNAIRREEQPNALVPPELYLPRPRPDSVEVSIVVPVFNQVETTLKCLRTLRGHSTKHVFEVVVADDGSTDATPRITEPMPFLHYVRSDTNRGFAAACNLGARNARGDFLVFLNNDTIVCDGWLDALRRAFEDWPHAGLVGSKLVHPDGRLQECGGFVFRDASVAAFGRGELPLDSRFCHVREVDYPSAAALMIRRSLFEELGGFDERYERAYYEDVDLAFRVRERGWQVLVNPHAMVVHREGASTHPTLGADLNRLVAVNRERFARQWEQIVTKQPVRPPVSYTLDPQRPRVLLLDDNIPRPDRDAGSLRVASMLEILRSEGCHVTVGAWNRLQRDEDASQLERSGIEVLRSVCGDDLERYIAALGVSLDFVLFSRRLIGARFIDAVERYCPCARVIFDTVDLHFLREARGAQTGAEVLAGDTLRRRKAEELDVVTRSDVTLVVSEQERNILHREVPSSDVRILSLILEKEPTTRAFADRDGILFVGYFAHRPNVDAIVWFVRDVLPSIDNPPTLHIVGSEAPAEVTALASDRVYVHGHVPEVREMFDSCRISVAPLRYGAGVKGKVAQSLALGVPCVMTSIGAEGMSLRDGLHGLIADDPLELAAKVARVHEDERIWSVLRQGGFDLVENLFSPAAAREVLRSVLREPAGRRGLRGAAEKAAQTVAQPA